MMMDKAKEKTQFKKGTLSGQLSDGDLLHAKLGLSTPKHIAAQKES